MPIILVDDCDENFLVQHMLLGLLAFPGVSETSLREFYLFAIKKLTLNKDFNALNSEENGIIARASSRIFIRGISAAKVIHKTIYELERGYPAPSWQIHSESILADMRIFYSNPNLNLSLSRLWEVIWKQRLPVCAIATTILEKMQSTGLNPTGLAVFPNWGAEAVLRTEKTYFKLAQYPIYGIDPSHLLRIKPTSLEQATMIPLDDGPEIVAFTDAPTRLKISLLTYSPSLPYLSMKRDKSPRIYKKRLHYFVKPTRMEDQTPTFDWDYGIPILQQGITPIIIPDANVLSRMLEFMQVFTELDDINGSGIDEIFRDLISGPTAYFCPSFAYAECGQSAFKPTKRAVDTLFSWFAPGIVDENIGASQETFQERGFSTDSGRTPFWKLSETMRAYTAGAYLLFLRASLINRNFRNCSRGWLITAVG